MVKTLKFSPDDRSRIAAAVHNAESATSGEIFAVFARRSDGYRFVSGFFALLLSLVLGLILSALLAVLGVALPAFAVEGAQAIGAAALLAAVWLWEDARMLFVPKRIAAERAHRQALAQFLAHGIHITAGRTGVLLYVSEAEHYAEVVADAAINEKVGEETWSEIVTTLTEAAREDRLAEGFVAAVEKTGVILTRHFPAGETNPNEIPDGIVEI
ncbi:TPM domain-containing protein [Consotaella salsifontis]|uniref:Putative membrane protein n=1 Tax=Consotaella salsifontis TaxID=1365950 RepID=A0A1T4T569_9HYPH|nr:hypothetical protein [Consotaella salsifontis]SKA35547.1 putative membrane protein [Consotaella salsifontis]